MRYLTLAAMSLLVASQAAQAQRPSCSTVALGAGPPVYYDPYIVFFDSNSAAITAEAAAILTNVVRTYSPLSHCLVVVTGHTDRVGTERYNLALSQRRAESIANYLRRHSVRARLHLQPFGETRPLVETADGVAEIQNRRSEIVVGPPDRPR